MNPRMAPPLPLNGSSTSGQSDDVGEVTDHVFNAEEREATEEEKQAFLKAFQFPRRIHLTNLSSSGSDGSGLKGFELNQGTTFDNFRGEVELDDPSQSFLPKLGLFPCIMDDFGSLISGIMALDLVWSPSRAYSRSLAKCFRENRSFKGRGQNFMSKPRVWLKESIYRDVYFQHHRLQHTFDVNNRRVVDISIGEKEPAGPACPYGQFVAWIMEQDFTGSAVYKVHPRDKEGSENQITIS